MDIAEALRNCNLSDLMDRMTAYVYSRLKSVNVKNLEGKEPIDFVGAVLEKALTGVRKWNPETCTIDVFLFGCLKSDLYSFFKTKKYIRDEVLEIACANEEEYEEEKKWYIDQLIKNGAKEDEIQLFSIWLEGIVVPALVSEELQIDVKNIYQTTKRLERRLDKINLQLKPVI